MFAVGHASRTRPPVDPHPVTLVVLAEGEMKKAELVVTPVMVAVAAVVQVFAAMAVVPIVIWMLAIMPVTCETGSESAESVPSVLLLVAVTFSAVPVVFWFSVGMSAATMARKDGVPAAPLGAARKVLAVSELSATARAGVVVELVTVGTSHEGQDAEAAVKLVTVPDPDPLLPGPQTPVYSM